MNYNIEILLKKKTNLLIVVPFNKELKAFKTQWETFPKHKFEKGPIVILNKFITKEYCTIGYLNIHNKVLQVKLPNDFKMRLATLKERSLIKGLYDKYIVDNIQLPKGDFYLGSDPEIFVENTKGLIPAFEFLKSKKENKNTFWDGFQAEFITTPYTCLSYQIDSIQNGLQRVLNAAKVYDKDAKLSIKTCFDISQKLLTESKEEHVEFGCMPSLNIYNMKGLKASGREVPYRSAGGHIHFGFGKKTEKEIEAIVKSLDAILGVACVSLFAKYDDPKRRTCYGLAGEYRLPPHGLEYRTLSNAWLCHPLIANIVFDVARRCVTFADKGYLKYWNATEKETIDCINNCDVTKAQEIIKRNEVMFKRILQQCYGHNIKDIENKLYDVFINGVDSLVKDTSDFISNWNLDNNYSWVGHCDGIDKNVSYAITSIMNNKKVA